MLVSCGRIRDTTEPAPSSSSKRALGLPKIEFDSRRYDFGTVNEGSIPKHAYSVRNAGTAPLVLRAAYASCGCVMVTKSAEEIPPGGTAKIEVAQHTRGFPGDSHMSLTVESNDPNEPTSVLEFHAQIEPLLDFDPPYPMLNTRVGVDKTERVWLTGKLSERVQLAVAKTDCGERISAVPITRRQGMVTHPGIELKLHAARATSGACEFTLATDVENPAELNLRVNYAITDAH